MRDPTERQLVELFHLVFVRALFAGLPDKTLVAIKGGINLRFFFASIRYSEDIDFDVRKMAKPTLEKRIDTLLRSPGISAPLKSRGITIVDHSKPKQTETVQRWKIHLAHAASSLEAHTKAEFSRRSGAEAAQLDPVANAVTDTYEIQAFLANHYRCREAVQQKIRALADRTAPQARDVFDLDVLIARADAPRELEDDAKDWVERAATRAADLTYDEYKSTVVAYLEPTHAATYESRAAWEAMQARVVERILRFA